MKTSNAQQFIEQKRSNVLWLFICRRREKKIKINIDCVSCGVNAFGRSKHQRSTEDLVVISPSLNRTYAHVYTRAIATISTPPIGMNVKLYSRYTVSHERIERRIYLLTYWKCFVVNVSVHLRRSCCKIL